METPDKKQETPSARQFSNFASLWLLNRALAHLSDEFEL